MKPQIITIVGKSNSGKTTLVEKLIAELTRRGYQIGSVKHTHCGFEIDKKGKDSWRHRQAGASATLMISDSQTVLVKDDQQEPVVRMRSCLSEMDLILAEGFKSLDLPKIEVFRLKAGHKAPLFLKDNNLIALATDMPIDSDALVFGLDEYQKISDLIENRFLK